MNHSSLLLLFIFSSFIAKASADIDPSNSEQIEMMSPEKEAILFRMIQDQCTQLLTDSHQFEPTPPIILRHPIEFFEYNNQRMNIFELIKQSFELPPSERPQYIVSEIEEANLPQESLRNIIFNLQEEIQNTIKRKYLKSKFIAQSHAPSE